MKFEVGDHVRVRPELLSKSSKPELWRGTVARRFERVFGGPSRAPLYLVRFDLPMSDLRGDREMPFREEELEPVPAA